MIFRRRLKRRQPVFGDIQNEDSKTAGVPKSAFTRKHEHSGES
jgi:hypothetical protein